MKRMWAACNRNLAVGIRNRNSQCSQASKGAGTVGAAGKVAQPRCALGKRSQHRIAVRNALITGQANRTNNIPRGLDNDVFHFPDDPESSSSAQLPECLIFISPAVALCRPTMEGNFTLTLQRGTKRAERCTRFPMGERCLSSSSTFEVPGPMKGR